MKTGAAMVAIVSFLMAIALLAPAIEVGAAPGTITWTTTSDFDSGTKNEPGQQWFAQNGVDQPNNWATSPRAWYVPSIHTLYTVWQGDADYKMYVASYDEDTQAWTGPVVVTAVNPSIGDGHGSPAIAVTPNGYIHVFCCSHVTEQWYFRSSAPYNISSWVHMADVAPIATYPNVVIPSNGTMYLLYRRNAVQPNGTWSFRYTKNAGTTWSNVANFLDFNTAGCASFCAAYPGNFELVGSKVWFSYSIVSIPPDTRLNLYSGYLNLADGYVYNVAGTKIAKTVTLSMANTYMLAKNTGTNQVWYPATHTNPSTGRPLVVFLATNGSVQDVDWTQWNGVSWTTTKRIISTGSANNMGDFYWPDSSHATGFFVVQPVTLRAGGTLTRFTFTAGAWTQGDAIKGNFVHAPMITQNHTPNNLIVFDERPLSGLRERLWAWGLAGFLTDRRQPGEFQTETHTDNLHIPADQFQLTSVSGDSFTNNLPNMHTFKWEEMDDTAYTTCAFGNRTIQGGVAEMDVRASNASACANGIILTTTVSDAWNLSVKITALSNDSAAFWSVGAFNEFAGCEATATNDGFYVRNQPESGRILLYKCIDGVSTFTGLFVYSSDDPVWIRIAENAAATEHYAWYSTNGISYTYIGAVSESIPGAKYPQVILKATFGGSQERILMDDFTIDSGTFGPNPFERTGLWASPVQTYGGDRVIPVNITVTYSGASASQYVDAIAFIASDGLTIYSDGTHRTSGSSASVTLPNTTEITLAARQDWRVRVTLAGDGNGSVVIQAISVTTELRLTSNDILIAQGVGITWMLSFIGIIALMLMGAWWVKQRRSGG